MPTVGPDFLHAANDRPNTLLEILALGCLAVPSFGHPAYRL